MASGPGRGSMALASAALLLLEDARAASQGAPAVRAGGAPSTPGSGVLGSTGRSPSGTPRGGASARKRRMQEAAAAAEEAVLRKASFAKAKHEIDELRESHHRVSDVYEANIAALQLNTTPGNRAVAEKAVSMHHRVPVKRKKKKQEENWSVFAEADTAAAERKKQKMAKYEEGTYHDGR